MKEGSLLIYTIRPVPDEEKIITKTQTEKEKSSGAIRARGMCVKTEAWIEAAYDKKLNREYYIKARGLNTRSIWKRWNSRAIAYDESNKSKLKVKRAVRN